MRALEPVTFQKAERRLDPRSPLPLYAQLREILTEEIATLRPGDRLPSEPQIVETFKVSRATVRQAIAELERAGLLERRRGFGTFVVDRRNMSWQVQSEHGWHEDMIRRGHRVSTRILHQGLDRAPGWVVEALRLGGDRTIRIDRVRSIDDAVVLFIRNYLHPELCAAALDADLTDSSLYAWLEQRYGLRVKTGTRTVRATAAHAKEAKILGVRPGAPLLHVEAISLDERRGPFECYEAWHRGDRASLYVVVSES
jgi:GntR family transcriptional regulator